ncbi:MAG: type IV pilus assembly protein PilB [Candidatus Saganbacteria bacterium]|uniref:Type IV pilus assembly protein PilB n=1 Tax=Candidatus Saganbacteria bacterium TaxID=2575572 RepID=A0A833NWI7_UNCSA|nr:MAG: type IV pilus assembly protein PilB [Candidatus Saganbacteria bacterium]
MPEENIISVLNDILAKAIDEKASDIHIEPMENDIRIRFRVDGLLKGADKISKTNHSALISRIKIISGLDIAETRLPQDGRIEFNGHDMRVSTIPTINGEKAVLRLLERKKVLYSLDELGMDADNLLIYRKLIAKKSGIILITGPTGSGKTTTLYATLKEINNAENNIVTIEDPVEYKFPGINQIQINNKAGITFPKMLRSVLRQDPDIIFIGEIRDVETARIAVQAALTGHLVFATLHTKDAASSVIRLSEMGIEEYLLKDCILGAVAQRLIRIKPSGRRAIFEVMLGSSPQKDMKTLAENAMKLISRDVTTKEEVQKVLD